MAVLYHQPLFNQPGWLFYLMWYLIWLLGEITQDRPTWCNFLFNTNVVISFLTVLTFKNKPVLLSQLLHLIATDSTFYPLHYVHIKINSFKTLKKYLIIKVLVIYLFQWYIQYVPQWREKETTELFILCWLASTFCYHDDQFIFI